METSKMEKLYQNISDKVGSMIPEEWNKVYFYGEILNDSRTVYFFYNRASDGKIIYSHDIPSVYKVDKRLYLKALRELSMIVNELHTEYDENNENSWKNITFVFGRNGQFDMKFGYDDFSQGEYNLTDLKMIWMYEVLGTEPEDEVDKQKLELYKEKNIKLFWK